jgi:hypothetical protein
MMCAIRFLPLDDMNQGARTLEKSPMNQQFTMQLRQWTARSGVSRAVRGLQVAQFGPRDGLFSGFFAAFSQAI